MEKAFRTKYASLLIIATLLIAGCSRSTPPIRYFPTSIETPISKSSSTSIPRLPSLTPIKPSPVPSPTALPTPSPSLAPLPTLDADAAQQEISRLLRTNDGCTGLCFWGIKPGATSFIQALQYLRTLNDKGLEGGKENYQLSYHEEKKNIFVALNISGANGVIQNLDATIVGLELPGVTGNDWLAFRPDNFLKSHGRPDRVNIIMHEGPEGRLSYDMILLYDQMYIRYSGNQMIIKPQTILHACPIRDHNINRVDLRIGQYDERISNEGIEISRISLMTADNFYQTLTGDPEKACFDLDYK